MHGQTKKHKDCHVYIYTCEEGEVHSLSSPLSSAEGEGEGGRERIKQRQMKCHVHV